MFFFELDFNNNKSLREPQTDNVNIRIVLPKLSNIFIINLH